MRHRSSRGWALLAVSVLLLCWPTPAGAAVPPSGQDPSGQGPGGPAGGDSAGSGPAGAVPSGTPGTTTWSFGSQTLVVPALHPRAVTAPASTVPPWQPVTPPATTAGGYTKSALWVMPHEDDEGSLWADQLNNDGSAFPVFVFLTNGENTGYCTNDTPVEYAPTGTLGTADAPPFNWAGDLPDAPPGYVGSGPPPQYAGAQGDNPPVFPRDPPLDRTTGLGPLLSADSYTGVGSDGTSYTEGFDGPCRAARMASMTMMFSQENAVVDGLSADARNARFPSVSPGQPPDGQICFSTPMGESYRSEAGTYSVRRPDGSWDTQAAPAGNVSGKDPCAYDWLTPTGDILVFNLGDQSLGYRSSCPPDEGGRLTSGPAWPGGTVGFDSAGTYPVGARPGDASGCPADLPDGLESYTASPSDVNWMIQSVFASGLLPPDLPLAAVNGSAFLNGFNPAVPAPGASGLPGGAGAGVGGAGVGGVGAGGLDTGSIDVGSNHPGTSCYWLSGGGSSCSASPPSGACEHYLHPNHLGVGLDLVWNRPLPVVRGFTSICSGDPAAAQVFGTGNRADGQAFWTAVFNNDGSGQGWQAAYRAYAWDTGLSAFDPYGNVTDTCPGSSAVVTTGQWQFACQEAVSDTGGPGPPTPPGDRVRGMRNVMVGPDGEEFTYPA